MYRKKYYRTEERKDWKNLRKNIVHYFFNFRKQKKKMCMFIYIHTHTHTHKHMHTHNNSVAYTNKASYFNICRDQYSLVKNFKGQ